MYLTKNILKKILFNIYCRILNNSQIIVCQNKDDKKILSKYNINLKRKIVIINGSGIDINNYQFKSINHKKKSFDGRKNN